MFLLHSVAHLVRIPAVLVSSALMDNYLWMPFALAFGFMAATFLCVAGIPETLPRPRYAPLFESGAIRIPTQAIPERSIWTPVSEEERNNNQSQLQSAESTTTRKIAALLRQPVLCIIFLGFLLKRVAFASVSEAFIYQYASERFKMKLSQTFGIRLTEIVGALVTTIVILPLVTHLWHAGQTYLARRDLWIARGSIILLIGCFISVFRATSITSVYSGMRYSLAFVRDS